MGPFKNSIIFITDLFIIKQIIPPPPSLRKQVRKLPFIIAKQILRSRNYDVLFLLLFLYKYKIQENTS